MQTNFEFLRNLAFSKNLDTDDLEICKNRIIEKYGNLPVKNFLISEY